MFLSFHLQRQKAVATGCLERPAKPNDILGFPPTSPKYGQQILGLKKQHIYIVPQWREIYMENGDDKTFINTENPQKTL